jgi:ribosomal protein L40E
MMYQALPFMLLAAAAIALVMAIYSFWQSLRAAFGPEAFGDEGTRALAGSEQRRALLLEKDALLSNLKDLEFERDSGKIAPDDFARVERKLRRRAKEVLRALDDEIAPYRADAEALIEKHLRRGARAEAAAPGEEPPPTSTISTEAPAVELRECPLCTTPNEISAEWCRSCDTRLLPMTCTSCAAINDPDATYCKKCGAQLDGRDGAPALGAKTGVAAAPSVPPPAKEPSR